MRGQIAPGQAGFHADGEIARLVFDHAAQRGGGDGGIGGLDRPGHPPLAGIPGERDGAPARGGTAERLREFRGSGGRERFYQCVP